MNKMNTKDMRKIILTLLTTTALQAYSQENIDPINAGAANFLTITPDARAAGMGGAGLALPGGGNTIFHNAAAMLFDESGNAGASYTYTPCMRDYDSGYSLHAVGGYYKTGGRHAILAGFRYYGYPDVEVAGTGTESTKKIHPDEMAIELGYTYKIISPLAASVTLRYIRSDMGNLNGAKAADAVAFDIGAFYRRDIGWIQGATWAAGIKLSNIGTKIKYLETKESIPATARLGGSADLPFSPAHKLIVAADLGYRLSPSDVTAFSVGAGAEYTYDGHFMARAGYHYGDKKKADFSYTTAGVGVRYFGAEAGFSWLFADNDNPWRNTFRISLGYSF